MFYAYLFATFGLTMIGAGLLASSDLIAELADANMYPNANKQALIRAKKLDVNNDGLISLDELSRRQSRRYQKVDRKEDVKVDEVGFNARLVVMFNRIDSNSDGKLDDDEISKLKHHH